MNGIINADRFIDQRILTRSLGWEIIFIFAPCLAGCSCHNSLLSAPTVIFVLPVSDCVYSLPNIITISPVPHSLYKFSNIIMVVSVSNCAYNIHPIPMGWVYPHPLASHSCGEMYSLLGMVNLIFYWPYSSATYCTTLGKMMVIYSYQPFINFLSLKNIVSFNALVKISPRYRVVSTYHMGTILSLTKDLKRWYFNTICFVWGLMQGISTRSMHPFLSLKIVQWMAVDNVLAGTTSFNSLSNSTNRITSLI